jgi:hypothetical protein
VEVRSSRVSEEGIMLLRFPSSFKLRTPLKTEDISFKNKVSRNILNEEHIGEVVSRFRFMRWFSDSSNEEKASFLNGTRIGPGPSLASLRGNYFVILHGYMHIS